MEKIEPFDLEAATKILENNLGARISADGDILFAEQIKSFSDKDKIILSRMARYGLKTPAEIQKSSGEPSNVISKYMEYFLSKGVLQNRLTWI